MKKINLFISTGEEIFNADGEIWRISKKICIYLISRTEIDLLT